MKKCLFIISEDNKTKTETNESPMIEKDKDKDDQTKPQNLTCCILMLDILLKQVFIKINESDIFNYSK